MIKTIEDYVLRKGAYKEKGLSAEFGKKLVDQKGFEEFNHLLSKIRQRYVSGDTDPELHKKTLCFLNSPFWNYERYLDKEGNVDRRILEDMQDNTLTMASLNNNLERMSNAYKGKEEQFLSEKVILNQQLRPMINFFSTDQFPYVWQLLPLLILRELEQHGRELLAFATEDEPEKTNLNYESREWIMHQLEYLDDEYESGRIISETEYEQLTQEVIEIVSSKRVPRNIVPLEMSSRGTLKSGDSYKYISYGVSRVFWHYSNKGVGRELWIDYLSQKTGKEKSLIHKKFTDKPEGLIDKLRGRMGI